VKDQCFLRLELVDGRYLVVDQDGRPVQGVQTLAVEVGQEGVTEITMRFLPYTADGKRAR